MKIYKLINFTRYFINIIVIAAFILGTTGSSLASASMDQPATLDRWQDTTALKPNLIGGEPLMVTAGEGLLAVVDAAAVREDFPLSTAQGSAETEVPILLEPEDGVQFSSAAPFYLSFSEIPDAMSYEIIVDNDPEFSSPEIQNTLNFHDIVYATLPAGTYHWMVRFQDQDSIWSDWSSSWSFTLIDPTGDFSDGCASVIGVTQQECEGLVALYNQAGGDYWTNNTGWLSSDNPCSWYGVSCNDDHVVRLVFGGNNLDGSIPAEIANLVFLTKLSLTGDGSGGSNDLSGNIPSELFELTNLQHLNLEANQLTGTIPPAIGNLSVIEYLDISDNQLSGSVPPEIGSLSLLQSLVIYMNSQMTGTLPMELTQLSNIKSFGYFETGLCAPSDASFQDWLAGIDNLQKNTNCPVVTVPTLLSPADGTILATNIPTFSWSVVTDAAEYEFAIDDEVTFNTPVQRYTVTPSEETVRTMPEALPNGTYYWRVRVKDSAGYWSDWSMSWSIKLSIIQVSVASDGSQANDMSSYPIISSDGRYVVFSSQATNLVEGFNNSEIISILYIHDTYLGSTSIVGDQIAGLYGSGQSSISADGRYISFLSVDNNDYDGDVLVLDQKTGESELISVSSSGVQGNSYSDLPSISADGRFVAFRSEADNLVASDSNSLPDIFVHDRETGETTLVSVSTGGIQANSWVDNPTISADGRFVAFSSYADNLVSGDTNFERDVFIHDRLLGETTRVSISSDGLQGNSLSWYPSISANGQYVAFTSHADLDNGFPVISGGGIFVHNRLTGETKLVSISSEGSPVDLISPASISANGRYITFFGQAHEEDFACNVFIHDQFTGDTQIIDTYPTDYLEYDIPSVSADGRYVAFISDAENMVGGDTNGTFDIFVHDRFAGNPPTYAIFGHVIDAGQGLPDVTVSVDSNHTTKTLSNGYYAIFGLPAGSYTLTAYLSEYGINEILQDVIITDSSQTGVDFIINENGSISGHIYQSDGTTPIEGAWVYAMDVEFNFVDGTNSDVNGAYSIPLAAGQYVVFATADGYGGTHYGGYDDPSATVLTVNEGEDTSGININLSPEATVSGYVFASDGATPIEGAYVKVWPAAGGQVQGSYTDATGAFTVDRLSTGTYVAKAEYEGLVSEFYLEAQVEDNATNISVTQPNNTPNINFTLSPGGSISGYIHDTTMEANVVADAEVCAMLDDVNNRIGCDTTDLNGYYQITNLPVNADYRVAATAGGYLRTFYEGTARWEYATSVAVVGGQDTPGIDLDIIPADSYITGHVSYPDGSPAANIWMEAFHDDGWFVGINADENGDYSIPVIEGWWMVFPYQPPYDVDAQDLYVTTGETVTEVDFQLSLGGSISGHAFQEDGVTPISDAWIYAMNTNFQFVEGTHSDATGAYELILPAGQYYLAISAEGFGGVYFDNGYDDDHATLVTVIEGEVTGNIDFTLSPEATVSGHVYASDGTTPIEGAYVQVSPVAGGQFRSSYSDLDGSFTVGGLSTGNYVARAMVDGYLMEYYLDAVSRGTATPITVMQPYDTPEIDFTLSEGGTISGYVMDESNNPLADIVVSLDGPGYGDGTCTATDGYYEFTGVDFTTNWRVRAAPEGDNWCGGSEAYSHKYWQDELNWERADTIRLTELVPDVGNINFQLMPGGRISGVVEDSSGNPVEGACVNLFASEDDWSQIAGWGNTGADGTYSFAGVPVGEYYVRTHASCGGSNWDLVDELYGAFGSTLELTQASKVTILAGQESSGIDFQLNTDDQKPHSVAYPLTDTVNGWEWDPNTTISVTIGEYVDSATSNAEGFVHFELDSFDLTPGMTVELNDGSTLKSNTVRDFAVTGLDPVGEVVTGTAVAETRVNVAACDHSTCEWQHPYADEFGNWSVDFSGLIDMQPGGWGFVNQWELDGDGTEIQWNLPSPHILVHPLTDDIEGWDWEPDASVTLTIGEFSDSLISDGDGHFHFFFDDFDLLPGQLVEITDGVNSDSHLVRITAIVSIDQENDIVYGTAEPGSELAAGVWVNNDAVYANPNPVTDGNGNWSANFQGLADIRPGSSGWVNNWDEDGDETQVHWYIHSPHILVHPASDEIEGWEWEPNADISLTIGSFTDSLTSDGEGRFHFYLDEFDIQPGQLIEINDGVNFEDHQVRSFTIDIIDTESDTISGTAVPGSQLAVYAWNGNQFIGWAEPQPVADEFGNWIANFAGVGDIKPGVSGGVNQWDEDGDETQVHWYLSNPHIRAYPDLDHQYLAGYDWLPDTEVFLTIGDFSTSAMSDSDGFVIFEDFEFILLPGMVIEMNDGTTYRTHTIFDITFTEFNEELDTISGMASPGEVETYACDYTTCEWVYTEADENGFWTADYNGLVDIAPGGSGGARQYDEDGNTTRVYWNIPRPRIGVDPVQDIVEAYDWTPGATVYLNIGSYSGSLTADEYGKTTFGLKNVFNILPGQVAVMTDGTSTAEHVVSNVAITNYDEENDIITGIAVPGSRLDVYASDGVDGGRAIVVYANTSGVWQANFSGTEDIQPGTIGEVYNYDADWNWTDFYWEVLPPPPANDLVGAAVNLVPGTPVELNTKGATTSLTDPALGACMTRYNSLSDKGKVSVWYKFIPSEDTLLTLDTSGSGYDTLVAIYLGTPSTTSRKACNDDISDSDMASQVSLDVKKGSTYYIEIVDTGFTDVKAGRGEAQHLPQIGGNLVLNAGLTACYTLTTVASPSTSGTISKDPAPNCVGTKYIAGTEIVLSALPKTTTNFWRWSDDSTGNVKPVTMDEDKNLTAYFVGIPGAVSLSSPASGALLHLEDVYPKTPITLKWLATSILSVEYEVQVARNNLFTDDLHTDVTTELQLQPDWLEADKTYYWKVRGINAAGGAGAWSAVRYFRVAVLKPDGLGVYDDADDETADDALNTNRPQFRWDEVEGASGYYLQIARNAAFTSIVTSGTLTGGTNTAFTPAVNLPVPTATYPLLYWRVRANSPVRGPGLYTEGATFTVPPAPPMPYLTSPANNALTTDPNPTLNWSDVTGADGYDWQIARDAAFTDIHDEGTVDIIPLVSQADVTQELDPATTYYWRVRTLKSGMISGWTAPRSLRSAIEAPELWDPPAGYDSPILRPTLAWTSVQDATGYTVQIARQVVPTISLVGTYSRTALQTDYTPASNLPMPTATYPLLYWRVQTKSTAYGPSDWSDWRFMEMPKPPSTPSLVAPAANALVQPEAVTKFDWSNSTIPTGVVLGGYTLGIFTDLACAGIPVTYDSNNSEYSLTGLPENSKFYWAVRAYNTAGEYSAWSACRVFRTAVTAPVLEYPPDDAVTTLPTNRPTFTWQPVDGATNYTVQVSRNATFTLIAATGTATGPSWSPTANLPLVPLFWRVRANSTTNGPGAWSNQFDLPYWSFLPGAPLPIPTLVAPLHGALSTTPNPTFSWRYVLPVTPVLQGYKLQVARDSSFTDLVIDKPSLGVQTSYTVLEDEVLETGKTYYWRVAADFGDTYSGWATARTLRIALPPPELTSPAEGENPLHLRPTFDWEEVTGATGYTLQISRNNTFTSLVGSYSRTALQTDYTPTSNLPAPTATYPYLYWRVRTNNATYGPSAWSDYRMLDMPNPPGIPSLVSPASGATLTTRNPRLDWSNVTLPTGENWGRYEVQVATDSAFSNVVRDEAVDGLITDSEYTVEDGLLSGTYYWRVRAFNTGADPESYDDEYSTWSAIRSFKINVSVLKIGTTAVIQTLDPIYVSGLTDISYVNQLYEGLTRYNENLETVPAAAQSWEYNEDATELTFTLRPGLRYSDGTLLNAKRFEDAIKRFLSKDDTPFWGYLDMIESVEARDVYGDLCSSYTQPSCNTLWLRFNRPTSNVHTLMAMWIIFPVKAERIAAGGEGWWAVPANQVGNGPFKLSAFDADGKTTLVPNTYYRGGAPTYRIEYIYYPDMTQRLNAYRVDELDLIPFSRFQYGEISADIKLNTEKLIYTGPSAQAIMFALDKEPFTDPYVRQAFALAFDREQFITDVFGEGMMQSNLSWIPEGFPGYDDETTQWAYDPTAAVAALAASSYGEPAQVPEITITYASNAIQDMMYQWLETHWEAELGVTINLNPVDESTFSNALRSDELTLFSYGWTADNPDPQNWLSIMWRSGKTFANWTKYASPLSDSFDALIDQADSEPDQMARMALYQQAQRQLMLDLPMVPWWNSQKLVLVKPWVQGLQPTSMDYTWTGEQLPLAVTIQ